MGEYKVIDKWREESFVIHILRIARRKSRINRQEIRSQKMISREAGHRKK
jgi:hypothetical protein